MLKQVQQMQAGLAAAQEKLASQTVTTEGAGGKLKDVYKRQFADFCQMQTTMPSAQTLPTAFWQNMKPP